MNRAILTALLGLFLVFTLVYTTSTQAIIYDHICQDTFLQRTYNSNITTDGSVEVVSLVRDPINCTYGCTNLTFPASCRLNTATDLWSVNFMAMPIYILLEIMAVFFFVIGIIYRSEDGETFIILPIISLMLFATASITAINIEGQYNMVMMYLNMGFTVVSLLYVIYTMFIGSVRNIQNISDDNLEE
jgi:hypothetical protein